MLDWTGYRTELKLRVGDFGKAAPDALKGYAALSAGAAKTQHLDARTRELISLGQQGAEPLAARLTGLGVDETAYAQWRNARPQPGKRGRGEPQGRCRQAAGRRRASGSPKCCR